MKLEIDSEKMKAAAKTCPDVEKVFKTLWPEQFLEQEPTVPFGNDSHYLFPQGHPLRGVIQIRSNEGQSNHQNGLFLDSRKGYRFSLTEGVGHQILNVIRKSDK